MPPRSLLSVERGRFPFTYRRHITPRVGALMTRYIVTCDYCQTEADLAQPGRFCSPRHRSYWHRDRLLAQRQRLAAEADAALRSGDVLKLEHVARETARLLAV